MKYLITLIVISASSFTFAQKITYEQWKNEAKSNIRLLPEYGNVQKTEAMKKIDEEFIRETLKEDNDRRKASNESIERGFRYLYSGDLKVAMYRFNQAWLLDPTNENVWWGFGGIYFQFEDFREAERMYKKGLQINPNSANILTDLATLSLMSLYTKFDKATFNKTVELLSKSFAIDPKNENTSYKLSTTYFLAADCNNARKYYDICMKSGGHPIDKEYAEALNKRCKINLKKK